MRTVDSPKVTNVPDYSKWRLVNEIGIERNPIEASVFEELFAVAPSPDGHSFFVVDARATGDVILHYSGGALEHMPLPFLRDTRHEETSIAVGERDDLIVLAGREPREVIKCSLSGTLHQRFFSSRDTHDFGPIWPTCVASVGESVVIGHGAPMYGARTHTQAGLLVIGPGKSPFWHWKPDQSIVRHVTHLTVVPSRGIVLADVELHQVLLVGWDQRVKWTFGIRGMATNGHDGLNKPVWTSLTPDRTILVADMNNDRLVELTIDGRLVRTLESNRDETFARLGPLVSPVSAHELPTGELLVADGGNARVVHLSKGGHVLRSLGHQRFRRRILSFPRSIQQLGRKSWLIADTNNNRVIEMTTDNIVRWQLGGEEQIAGMRLCWPRSVRRLPNGSTLIADGGNGRVLLVDRNGDVRTELRRIILPNGRTVSLRDPHDVRETYLGTWLLVDSAIDLIVEVDPAGLARWFIGGPDAGTLTDPHQIIPTSYGQYLVADGSGIVTIASGGLIIAKSNQIRSGDGSVIRLGQTRALLETSRLRVVADNMSPNRVVVIDRGIGRATEVTKLLTDKRGQTPHIHRIGNPRWLAALKADHLMISDYSSHRLIEIGPVG